jgi:tetratricopeptide (TPR) repeat protein
MATERLLQLQNLLSDNPKDSFIRYAIAKEFEGIQDKDAALNSYIELQKDDPSFVGLYYHLGKLLEELGNSSAAIETYRLGIEIGKKQSDFHAISELKNALTNLEMEL